MAELNQFQRSIDRIKEMLQQLLHNNNGPETVFYIQSLEKALRTIEQKMEEYRLSLNAGNGEAFDLSF